MDSFIYSVVFIINIFYSEAASIQEQLEHIARRREERDGISATFGSLPTRRASFSFNPHDVGTIIGMPTRASHLPEAEPILPAHTLIRPALGMLKSSVKFPHRELENGAGVYGNINNLGIKYDGRNERVLYTGFRRSGSDDGIENYITSNPRRDLADYIMIVPSKPDDTDRPKRSFTITNLVLDMDKRAVAESKILQRLKMLSKPESEEKTVLVYVTKPEKKRPSFADFLNQDDDENFGDERLSLLDSITSFESPSRSRVKRQGAFVVRFLEDENSQQNKENEDENANDSNTIDKYNILRTSNNIDNTSNMNKEENKISKLKQVIADQEMFNNIKISEDALDFKELIPDSEESQSQSKQRQWWFFNQYDFKPFPKQDD